MRIAFLSTMTGYYGGEVHLAELATGLRERGHDVVCAVRQGSELMRRLQERGQPIEGVPAFHWYDAVNVGRLRRILTRRGIQILHTHLPRDYYTAATATLGTGTVNVGTRHLLFPIGMPLLKRPFLGRFAAMIAVSEAVRQQVVGSGVLADSRVVTIPNGIACGPDPADQAPVFGPLRRACGAGPTDPVVGFVGRLCPTKGVEVLIQAAAILHPDWPGLKVCLIGDADGDPHYLHSLQRAVAAADLTGVVHFLGYRTDACRAAREFHVQVLPSLAEPFGLVTLEAMAQGCPVVVTATGGSPEIVRDGVEGFLVRPRDARQLARRLDVLLDSPGLAREMGRRGRLRLEKEFTRDLMLDRTEQVYRQALAAG